MKYLFKLSLILTLVCAIGCDRNLSKLDEISLILDKEPELAIERLNNIRHHLTSQSEKARYSLLMSMAMDRAYIDYTSDSLTSVALEYYLKYGSADEKLKAYYFHALVFGNSGERETEMEYLVRAEHQVPKARDHISIGRLYAACSAIYYTMIDNRKSLEYAKKALEQYKLAQDGDRILRAELRLSDCFNRADEPDSVKKYLNLIGEKLNTLNTDLKLEYYESLLVYDRYYCKDDITSDLNAYLNFCPNEDINWKQMANCYIALGRNEEAIDALDTLLKCSPKYKDDASYYSLRSEAYAALREFEQAYCNHTKYSYLSDSLSMAIYSHDTKYLKERYENAVLLRNEEIKAIGIILLSVVIVICLLAVIVHFRRIAKLRQMEKAELLNQYDALCSEKTELEMAISRMDGSSLIGSEVIRERLKLLNSVIAGYVNNQGDDIGVKAANAIKKATENKDDLLKSSKLYFKLLYPKFIEYLEEKGLNEDEVTICCMYCMGLSGKGLKYYTNNARHYIDCSMPIRRKLGLAEHDTNLNIYLRKVLIGFYPRTNA